MEYRHEDDSADSSSPESSVPAVPAEPGPIPDFTELGLLPAGIHTVTLESVGATLGSGNPRRARLWANFLQWFELLQQDGTAVSVFIDGSFTTSKVEPGDIDVVVELRSATELQARSHMVGDAFLKLIYRPKIKADYEVDVLLWAPEVPPKTDRDLVDFFQRVRPNVAIELGVGPEFRKGILRVML